MSSRASVSLVPGESTAVAVPAGGTALAAEPPRTSVRLQTLQIGLLASLLVWVVCWHWDTAASMAGIWWRSETFAHGMVVYPISIWLIWRVRDQLSGMRFSPAYWVLIPLAMLSLGWLLGELGGVQAARHFALVAMLALIVWLLVGTPIARVIAFPLAFTLLAVPIGEFLLPVLMDYTSDFTVGALRLSGIPVYREGNSFVVPTGSWSVVEACSGLRYLIASVTLGLLYAYLSYSSVFKRLLFVLASIVAPIVANWIRAYSIVMIGHLSGMKYAVGVDHLIYGWFFFGVVMMILFWIGSYWRDDDFKKRADSDTGRRGRTTNSAGQSTPATLFAGILSAVLMTVAPSYSEYLQSAETGVDPLVALPAEMNGWRRVENASVYFRPRYFGARSILEAVYERDTRRVGLFIAYYADEREGRELISSQNAVVTSDDRIWHRVAQRKITHPKPSPDMIETQLKSNDRELTVWHWYWIDETWRLDSHVIKLQQAVNRLLRRGDDAAVVMVYARSDESSGDASRILRDLLADTAPSIAQALAGARATAKAARLSTHQ